MMVNAGPMLVGHFVVMEIKSMLPARHLVLTAFLVALLAALQAQSVHAAFGITSVSGAVELPGPPPPNVLPGGNEGAPSDYLSRSHQWDGGRHRYSSAWTGCRSRRFERRCCADYFGQRSESGCWSIPQFQWALVSTVICYTLIRWPRPSSRSTSQRLTLTIRSSAFSYSATDLRFKSRPALAYIGTLEQGDVQIGINGGPPLAYYPGGVDFRGVEEDAFVLAIAGNTIIVAGSTSGPEIDQIRILTAPTLGRRCAGTGSCYDLGNYRDHAAVPSVDDGQE